MERRLTAFVLPVLLLTVALMYLMPDRSKPEGERDANERREAASGNAGEPTRTPEPIEPSETQDPNGPSGSQDPNAPRPESGAQEPKADEDWYRPHTFGKPGETGSTHVVFDLRGASVREIYLLDEPKNAQVRRAGIHSVDDAYQLVGEVQRNVVSMTMAEVRSGRGSSGKLGVDLEAHPWKLEVEDESTVSFSLRDDATGLTFRRTYRHEPQDRELLVTLSVRADSSRPGTDLARGLPPGSECELWLYGLSLLNPMEDNILGNPAVAVGVTRQDTGAIALEDAVRPDGAPNPYPLPEVARSNRGQVIDFAGSTNRFFGAFLHPSNEEAQNSLWKVVMEKWPKRDPRVGHGLFSVPVANYRFNLRVPDDGAITELEFRLYIGPKSAGVFAEREAYERYDPVMEVDLTPVCPCTIPGATTMAQGLLWGLRQLHWLVGSWGVAIMLLTLIVRGSLVPLNFRMQKSMRAYGARMQVLKPKLDEIKERNAKDPKKMQQEMIAFQRENKLFPPLGGCLPLLVTIPVFLGLFTALRVAYELRAEPFLGWIHDLSLPDRLFELGLPFVPYFNILPILMVSLWLVLQMGTPLPTDPQQRQMMKIMRFMPVLFGVMLFNYASGLMVYMVTSSMLGIVEQRVTRKILGPPPAVGGAAMPTF